MIPRSPFTTAASRLGRDVMAVCKSVGLSLNVTMSAALVVRQKFCSEIDLKLKSLYAFDVEYVAFVQMVARC